MNFTFVCPEKNDIFQTRHFHIINNKGIQIGADGSKSLDASIKLDNPCPFCGKFHEYHANEMMCPFSG
jgi:hypothetical protein